MATTCMCVCLSCSCSQWVHPLNLYTYQQEPCLCKSCLEYRSIGVIDKKDTDDGSKQEREEEEHKQGIAKHDVFGMNIKAKDVGDDGDVRAMDTSMQVPHMVKDIQYSISLQQLYKHCIPAASGFIMYEYNRIILSCMNIRHCYQKKGTIYGIASSVHMLLLATHAVTKQCSMCS